MEDGDGRGALSVHSGGRDSKGAIAACAELSRLRETMHSLLDLLDQAALVVYGDELQVLEMSPAVERLLGYRRSELQERSFFSILAGGDQGPAGRAAKQQLDSPRKSLRLKTICLTRGGGQVLVELDVRRLDQDVPLFCVVMRDRSEADRPASRGTLFGHRDPLTGLPNRYTWDNHIAGALSRAEANAGLTVAVLFVDLDQFKRINDCYGHSAGDHVLCVVAQRLVAAVRPMDAVARIGGDEFVVLLEGTLDHREIVGIARRICRVLRAPIEYGPHRLHVSASVGVRVAPARGESAAALLDAADRAMYHAKNYGRGGDRVSGWAVSVQASA